MAENVTRAFAQLLHGWAADEPAVEARCRLLLIDGLAIAAAGARQAGPAMMAKLARAEASAPQCTVIGQGFAASPGLATRVNGMAMHVLDFEPMWVPANHALSSLLPGLLALGEQRERAGDGPQGQGLLRALAKGIEAQGRLRLASHDNDPGKMKFHAPSFVGPIAAAAACGDLLGLDVDRLTMAFGIAASCSAGLQLNVGTMTKALHCGNAAVRGLEAAQLAALGFSAAEDGLASAVYGWGPAFYGSDFDPSRLVAPLHAPRLLDPGMAWKLFPSQYISHYAIAAALDCRKDIADPSAIAAVTITSPHMAYMDRAQPITGLAGKFSFQYTVAAALLDGEVRMSSFFDRRRFAPDMEAMLRRITLTLDPAISGEVDQSHAVVAVRLADGRVVERRCDAPPGSWKRPADDQRVRAKAEGLLNDCLPADARAAFWRAVDAEPLRIADIMNSLCLTTA
jgi:aconitate decarboxylase